MSTTDSKDTKEAEKKDLLDPKVAAEHLNAGLEESLKKDEAKYLLIAILEIGNAQTDRDIAIKCDALTYTNAQGFLAFAKAVESLGLKLTFEQKPKKS